MAGIKINQYPLERLAFGDDDYYDIDYWNGSAFETAKIKGSVIKTAIQAGIASQNIMDTNSLVLAGNFTHDLNSNNLVFDDGSIRVTNGDLGVLGGFNAQHDGVGGLPIASFISSGGNPVLIVDNTNEALGIGTSGPQISAILDIESTSKAVLLPRLTTTQRNNISTPLESMLIYNTTTDQFEFYSASGTWDALGGGDSIYTADGTVSTNRSINFSNNFLTFDNLAVFDLDAGSTSAFVLRMTAGNNSIGNGARIELYETSAYLGYPKSLIFKARKTEGDIKHIAYSNSTHGFYLTSGYNANDDFNNTILNSNRRFEIGDNLTFFQNTDLLIAPNVTTGTPALIGSENISLQGETVIKGEGTTTGTTLALYDNDTTPNKTWEWLDNGTMKGYNEAKIQDALLLPSVQEATNSATFTINSDQKTDGVLTAMSANTTIASPTGTPVQSQDLVFRFKDDGTARTLTWNAIFRAIGVTLPTTTVANKLTYVGCKYNSTDSKWDVIAVQQEA